MNYNNKILIAMPGMKSRIFDHSVIYMHTDSDDGTLGFIVNVKMDFDQASSWSNDVSWPYPDRVHLGGPVDPRLGYIVHSNDYSTRSTSRLNDYISYTGRTGIVTDVKRGIGPDQVMLLTGYCSWQPGQLQAEIDRNEWYVTDFDVDYLFTDLDKYDTWKHAIDIAATKETRRLLNSIDILGD
jgi:putative transcriptional regulator